MGEHTDGKDLVSVNDTDTQLMAFEQTLLAVLDHYGLPTDSIFVTIDERTAVFGNFARVMNKLAEDLRSRSKYLSKFAAAVAAGLFDAALNYLWDETVSELRRRVAQYDLSYFYDNAVSNQDKRQKLSSADDLTKLDDSELILGAKAIGLLSEVGYKHLDFIRYMRNWASAAHPNQIEITGLQLIGWLETCLKDVISLPVSDVALHIQGHLNNLKTQTITSADAEEVSAFFSQLNQEHANRLAAGYFGIYTRPETTQQARQNIHYLLPHLWDRVDEATREQFGVNLLQFAVNNDQAKKQLAQQFLELVAGDTYKPPILRVGEIANAIEDLLTAHRNFSNFYNEPPFARALQRVVGDDGRVPAEINQRYVDCVVEVFLTNGNGVAWNAEPIYRLMLGQFDSSQALMAILSFMDPIIASKLQLPACQDKYRELLSMMKEKVSAPAVKELIEAIEAFAGPLDRMKDDSRMKQRVSNLRKLLR